MKVVVKVDLISIPQLWDLLLSTTNTASSRVQEVHSRKSLLSQNFTSLLFLLQFYSDAVMTSLSVSWCQESWLLFSHWIRLRRVSFEEFPSNSLSHDRTSNLVKDLHVTTHLMILTTRVQGDNNTNWAKAEAGDQSMKGKRPENQKKEDKQRKKENQFWCAYFFFWGKDYIILSFPVVK